jgi:hypothetical protein
MQLGPKGAGATSSGSNYQKSFTSQPEAEPEAKQDEIPIIEENYTPSSSNVGDMKSISFEDSAAEEIDVKDIPF